MTTATSSRGRRRLALLAPAVLGGLLLTALPALPALPTAHSATSGPEVKIRVSKQADRSPSVRLDGVTRMGKVYVFATRHRGLQTVRFWVDDRKMSGAPDRVDRAAPYDLKGQDGRLARPLRTGRLSNGTHTITLRSTFANGAVDRTTGAFVVKNPTPVATTGFPSGSTTGVPAGTSLTPGGSPTIRTSGTVIRGKSLGCVTVEANNVTIRNSRIRCGRSTPSVYNRGSNLVLENVEIDGLRRAEVGIGFGGYTARRVNIHGVIDGLKMESNSTLVDSYVHHLHRTATSHADAIQSSKGSRIRIVHNNLQAYNPITHDPQNAVYQCTDTFGPTRNVTFEHNLVNGGNYALNVDITGPGSFRYNHFQRDSRYGPVNQMRRVTFDRTNVWHDTRRPIR
ncbi:MAG: hypothetical protein ACRDYU_09725 [Actinomycetes bacterium]